MSLRLSLIGAVSVVAGMGVSPSFAQHLEGQPTARIHTLQTLERVETVEVEALDLEAVLAEDESREAAGLAPRYAIAMPVSISPDVDGTWEDLNADTRVWRLRISSPDALSLNLGFTRYYMPADGRMILCAADLSGSYWRAAYSTSDFTLVELDDDPNPAYNVTFAGWDRTTADTPPAATTCPTGTGASPGPGPAAAPTPAG